MKILKIVLLCFILICFVNLSYIKSDGVLKISVESNSLVLQNNTSERIYYFVVEAKFSALLDWAPTLDHPFLDPDQSTEIPFDEIESGSQEPVKRGDRVFVYWWSKDIETSPANIHCHDVTL
jgi:hypothetical protein